MSDTNTTKTPSNQVTIEPEAKDLVAEFIENYANDTGITLNQKQAATALIKKGYNATEYATR